MMLSDVSQFVVLGEDPAHRSFIRAWLRGNDVSFRCIREVEPPAGKSGGCAFVLRKYREEAQSARKRATSSAATRLIVVIDADDSTINDRYTELAGALGENKCRQDADPICLLIPKREIETWVEALLNENASVDEESDYKPKSSGDVKKAARALATRTTSPKAPTSLVQGYAELAQLKRP